MWNFPICTHNESCTSSVLLQGVDFDSREEDLCIWKASAIGEFSMKQTYNALSGTVEEVNWHHIVWFKNRIPRHSIICWLACLRRLKTRSKLHRWGILENPHCLLCDQGIEDEDHLFAAFPFSNSICKGLILKMGYVRDFFDTWDAELNWCQNEFKGDGDVATIRKLCLNSFIYHIWT